jgi:hypothetical protein
LFSGFPGVHSLALLGSPEDSPFQEALGRDDVVHGNGVVRFGSGDYFARTLKYETLALAPLEEGTEERTVMGLLYLAQY